MAFCPQGYTAFILFIIHEAVWGFFVSYILFSACLVSLQLTWFRQTQLDTKHVLNVIPLFFLILFVVFFIFYLSFTGMIDIFTLFSWEKLWNRNGYYPVQMSHWFRLHKISIPMFWKRMSLLHWSMLRLLFPLWFQWGTILSPRKNSFLKWVNRDDMYDNNDWNCRISSLQLKWCFIMHL